MSKIIRSGQISIGPRRSHFDINGGIPGGDRIQHRNARCGTSSLYLSFGCRKSSTDILGGNAVAERHGIRCNTFTGQSAEMFGSDATQLFKLPQG